MRALLVALALMVYGCSASKQEDVETLEVSNASENVANNNIDAGYVGDMQDSLLGNEGSLENQDSSIADNNLPVEENESLANSIGQEGNASVFTGDPSSGVVRYTVRDGVDVYEQPNSSSNVIGTLEQGESILVSISGEFAQFGQGFIAIADLSEVLQPRVFAGNDWQ